MSIEARQRVLGGGERAGQRRPGQLGGDDVSP